MHAAHHLTPTLLVALLVNIEHRGRGATEVQYRGGWGEQVRGSLGVAPQQLPPVPADVRAAQHGPGDLLQVLHAPSLLHQAAPLARVRQARGRLRGLGASVVGCRRLSASAAAGGGGALLRVSDDVVAGKELLLDVRGERLELGDECARDTLRGLVGEHVRVELPHRNAVSDGDDGDPQRLRLPVQSWLERGAHHRRRLIEHGEVRLMVVDTGHRHLLRFPPRQDVVPLLDRVQALTLNHLGKVGHFDDLLHT
mmetsp:Transcript_25217/g.49181  ORF Transcript_25217/g.49181 Transcript_25217/m.49181 type:complete len:253 (+) Transcript_25217:260-1018(+)